jgi:hypothetical protein
LPIWASPWNRFASTRGSLEADRFLRSGQSRHPRHPAAEGGEKRLRVGDYRVRFTEESGEGKEGCESEGAFHIHAVRNRKEAYR